LTPNSTCEAQCPAGFYKNGSEAVGRHCPRCFHTCNKCESKDLCTECKNFTFLTPDGKCEYECPDGYYEHGTEAIGGLCRACSADCRECLSSSVCLTCENSKFLDPSSSTCQSQCPDGYFEHAGNRAVGRTCERCPAPCNKCESGSMCTECKDSAYLTPFATCEYTCPPGDYPNGVGEVGIVCESCSENCNSCDNAKVCTQCKNHQFLQPDGSCKTNCPRGYSELPAAGGVGYTCLLCAENCSLCIGPDVCLECRNSTYLTNYKWCEEECQDGYFELGTADIGRTCQLCPGDCNKCEATDHCTECKGNTYLTHSFQCKATCEAGYYPNKVGLVGGVCDACNANCSQCTSASTCTECRNDLYLTPSSSCETSCPFGYFMQDGKDGVGATCRMCPENCASCTNASYCTSCRKFTHLTHFDQCRFECPDGYYENGTAETGGTCLPCKSPCNTCETGSVCTECSDEAYLSPNATCEYACPTGYHKDGTGSIGRICKLCPDTCVSCVSQEECTLCGNFTFLTPTKKCEYTCPDGSYRDGVEERGRNCTDCPANHNTCITSKYPTQCKKSLYLSPSATCEDECPTGYYKNGTAAIGRTCPICAQNCSTCTSSTVCLTCKHGQYLTPKQWCDVDCPDGHYKNGTGDTGRSCMPCRNNCNTCLSEKTCTECKAGTFLTPSATCETECPKGYHKQQFPNGIGGTCALCPDDCLSCDSEAGCTACKNSTYLHDRTCKPRCPDGSYHEGDEDVGRECKACKSDCSQCEAYDRCTECKTSKYLTASWSCEGSCADGYYMNGTEAVGRTCELCAQNCSKCNSSTVCQECKNSKVLTPQAWCGEKCQAGYYESGTDAIGRRCERCAAECSTCTSATACTECRNSTYLTNLQQCKATCPDGYYHEGYAEIGRTCPPCKGNCSKCLSSTWCTECKDSTYLSNQKCQRECDDGYYKQGDATVGRTCELCSKDCGSCEGFEQCSQCTNNTYLTADKFCAGECGTGLIETGDTLKGRTCESVCFWCS